MKMQDVIAKLREEAPLLEKCSKNVDVVFNKAWGLFDDFRRAESDAGRMLLADAVCAALNEFAGKYRTLRCSIETVCLVNAEYKERLGPRAKKPKDAPGQQMLPGMEDGGVERPVRPDSGVDRVREARMTVEYAKRKMPKARWT